MYLYKFRIVAVRILQLFTFFINLNKVKISKKAMNKCQKDVIQSLNLMIMKHNFSAIAIGYLVYDQTEKEHHRLMLKNPSDFENDK